MAQSAVAAISTGCQMLKEGKAEIGKLKSTIEGGVKDAKAIYREVTGLWGWITGLFGGKPKKPAVSVAVPAEQAKADPKPVKAKRKEPEPELSYEEFQARQVHEICEQLKVYFDVMRQLKAHCRELEEKSLTTENVAESAIDRIEIEWQMKQLASQLNHAMVYGTPEDLGLGAMYENFLKMYDQILEEQEYSRLVKVRKERDAAWQRDLLRQHRIDRTITGITVVVAILWMWGVLLSLGWLVRIPAGSLRELLF